MLRKLINAAGKAASPLTSLSVSPSTPAVPGALAASSSSAAASAAASGQQPSQLTDADVDDDALLFGTGGAATNTVASDVPLLEDGMDVYLARSREWLKASKILLGFAERRAASEVEHGKTVARAARAGIDGHIESELRGEGSYAGSTLALLKQQEAIALRQLEFGNTLMSDVVAPLATKRDQHEKSRKRLQAHLQKEHKKYDEAVQLLAKTRQKYHAATQAWEKALADKRTEESTSYKVRLDKRTKEEDEAKAKMVAAEEAYRAQIKATNAAQEDMKRYMQLILSAYERLHVESDAKYKECLSRYLAIHQTYVDDLPGMNKALATQVAGVDNKADFHKFVSQTSRNELYNPRPFVFDKAPGTVTDPAMRASMYAPSIFEEPATAAAVGTTGEVSAQVPTTVPAAADIPKERMHKFMKQFAPALCQHCHQMTFRGIVCEACGIACHKNCVEKLKLACGKSDPARELVIFGVPLDAQPRLENGAVPSIVATCVGEVEQRGMDSEGIYRLAGIKSAVEKLSALFEQHGSARGRVDLSYEADINAVTGCFKAFLRQLPEPVIPFDLYDDFVQAAGLEKLDIDALAQAVARMPAINYDTLVYLMRHLIRVAEHSAVNKMQPSNLAIIFGPSLLHPDRAQDDAVLAFQENGRQCAVVERLIQSFDDIDSKAAALRVTAAAAEPTAAAAQPATVPSTEPAKADSPFVSGASSRRGTSRRMMVFDDDDDDDLDEQEIERMARVIEQNLSIEALNVRRSIVVDGDAPVRPLVVTVPPVELITDLARKTPSADVPHSPTEHVTIVASELRDGISVETLVRTLSGSGMSEPYAATLLASALPRTPKSVLAAAAASEAATVPAQVEQARPLPVTPAAHAEEARPLPVAPVDDARPLPAAPAEDAPSLPAAPVEDARPLPAAPAAPAAPVEDARPLPVPPAATDAPAPALAEASPTARSSRVVLVPPPPSFLVQSLGMPVPAASTAPESTPAATGANVLVAVSSTPTVNLSALMTSAASKAAEAATVQAAPVPVQATPAPVLDEEEDEEALMRKVRESLNQRKSPAPPTSEPSTPDAGASESAARAAAKRAAEHQAWLKQRHEAKQRREGSDDQSAA